MLELWVKHRGAHLASILAVKEFMIAALDESIMIQKKIKEEVTIFFKHVRDTAGFANFEAAVDINEEGQYTTLK